MYFSLFILQFFTISSASIINLKEENLISIKGVIDRDTSNNFFNDLKDFSSNSLDIFITSPGGSVMEGMKMIDYIKTLQNLDVEVNCYGDFAASMAFVILQSCTNRYAMVSSVLMQHQMSLGLSGPIENIKNYLKMIQDIETRVNHNQANRIGLTDDEFDRKIFNDWWISGFTALDENVVDKIVDVKCSSKLMKDKMVVQHNTIFGTVEFIFSKCPLVRNPLKVDFSRYDGDISNIDIYDIDNYITNIKKINTL